MKKETYTFIIGLGIGYNVKKFMEKPVNRVSEKIINNTKKKVADELYRIIMGGTPEEVVESRKRVSYYDYKTRKRVTNEKLNYNTIGELDLITFKTRKEAAKVLEEMRDLISDFFQCSVADYYDMNNHNSKWTDNTRGWFNLDNAYISSYRDKFYINLPTPKLLR